MVRVPVAPQVQPQVQQEQVAAPQFQAAPSPGMQSAMQLGQDLMQAGKMAIELQRDKQAMEFWKAKEERREQIAQGREAEAAAKEAAQLKAKTTDFIVDEAINLLGSQVGEVADIFGRTTGRESVERFEEANSAVQSLAQGIRDKLQDEDQIALFDMKVGQRIGVAQRNIRAHYSKQLDLAQKAARIGNLETLGREAATSSDTQDFVKAAAAAEAVINQMNTLPSGVVNQDVAKQQIQAWYGQYVGLAADRMIRNNDYASAHTLVGALSKGGRLEVGVADKMLSVISNAEELHSAREVGRNLFREGRTGGLTRFGSTAPNPSDSPVPPLSTGRPDINALVDVINSAPRSDEWKKTARDALLALENDRVASERRAEIALFEQGYEIAINSDKARQTKQSQYLDIPAEIWAQYTPEQQNALINFPRVDDRVFEDSLYDMVDSRAAPEEIADVIRKNPGKLTPDTRRRWMDTLSSPRAVLSISVDSDQFDSVVNEYAGENREIKSLLTGKTDDNKRDRSDLRYAWKQRIDLRQRELGRELAPDEKEQELRLLLSPGSRVFEEDTPVGWKWQTRKMQELGDEALFSIQTASGVDYLSEKQFEILSNYMFGSGYEMTPANIEDALGLLRKSMPVMEKKYD